MVKEMVKEEFSRISAIPFFSLFFFIYSLLSMISYFLRDETSDTDSVSSVAPLAEREQKGTWKKMEKK